MSDAVRRLLFGVFFLGLVGTSVELWLLDHHEDVTQSIPLLLALAAVVSGAHVLFSRGATAIRGFRVLMGLFILSGALGSVLHLRANMEFQRDIDPAMSGSSLVWKALHAKAPPALAPGTMVQLGLIGLISTLKHPRVSRSHE
jgi:hypothetical protein